MVAPNPGEEYRIADLGLSRVPVLVCNARIRLGSQLEERNRGKILLDILGIRDPSYCVSTRRMGNVGPTYVEET